MRRGVSLITICWALVALLSEAQSAVSNDSTSETTTTDALTPDSITVIGRLEEELPQEIAKSGTRLTVISAEDIKNGGYIDVASALQALAPGLYVSAKSGPFDYIDISLQGSRTEDVLWLIDGIRINNRLYAGTTPLDTIPASMIERIEILEGGQALFYGTQATAGAVNIVTKSFSSEPEGALNIVAGMRNTQHVDANFRDGFGPHQLVIWASADRSDGFQPYPTSDFQPSATQRQRAYEVQSVGAKYAFTPFDELRISTTLIHTDGRLDFSGPQLVANAYNNRDDNLLSVKVDYAPSEQFQLFAKSYGHWWFSHYTEFDNEIGNPGTLDVIENHGFWGYRDYGLNLMAKVAASAYLDAFVGYDLQRYSGNDAVLVISSHSEEVNAVYGQIRTTSAIDSNLHLAMGARYNHPSEGEPATVWNASGKYDLPAGLFVRASAGTAFRMPTAEELFANDPEDERGNPNLKPERSRTLNFSLGGHLPLATVSLQWELIGFYRDTRDLIDFATFDSTTDQDVFGNVPGKVTTRGEEAVLSAVLAEQVSMAINYTHARTTETGSSLQFDRVPKDQAKLTLDYHPKLLPVGGSLSVNHVGEVSDDVGGLGRFGYGNYTIVDLGARFFPDAARRHRIGMQVANAFNTTYSSRLSLGTFDASGDNYVVHNLGLPRTAYATYTYAFH
jgi:outer membrane cobalamin receptor